MKTNFEAYPFQYYTGGHRGYEWRVWRPDRTPHHFGHYATLERAQQSADRINAKLGNLAENKAPLLAAVFAYGSVTETSRERNSIYCDGSCDMTYHFLTEGGREVTVRHYVLAEEYHVLWSPGGPQT